MISYWMKGSEEFTLIPVLPYWIDCNCHVFRAILLVSAEKLTPVNDGFL